MKLIKNYWYILMLLALATACSNDFDLIDEWKDTPVVYGLISPEDSINYIRVEKAFLDPSTSALEIAQRPDSLYYENATVQIERVKTGEKFTLNRVDGNQIGLTRDSGIFASAPNYIYQLILPGAEKLIGGELYELQINRGDDKPVVTAETRLLDEVRIVKPKDVGPVQWLYGKNKVDLEIDWRYGEEASIFDVKIIFHYDESDPNDPNQFNPKTLTWLVDKGRKRNETTSIFSEVPGINFYQFLGNNIPERANAVRVFRSFDIEITGGGKEIEKYINVGQAANNSITSSQLIPTSTNLSEGFGIFSSTTTSRLKGFTFKSESRDTLRDGIYTKNLNFQ